jgi:uncharacterized protein
MATLNVKVVPGARQDRVVGAYGDAVKIQITAPPEDGKANAAVVRLLAEVLGLKPSQVELLAGHSCPRKVMRIQGLDDAEIRVRLGIAG